MTSFQFDVLVVGGGHAGAEAALAAARLGCATALITFSRDKIGQMSCNPAIGGLGKGQLVKEVDALCGEMGLAIDDTGIQFRTLNSSKGPAVRSSRAQADRTLYRDRICQAVFSSPNLRVIEAEVSGFLTKASQVIGVKTACGLQISARAAVVTTGTFLGGLMHTGKSQTRGGRVGEKASYHLSESLKRMGLRMGRLKTGTPPRLSKKSIDFKQLIEQPGDPVIRPFSFRSPPIERAQISCWITSTSLETHDIIAANVERSPLFNGQICSRGPRYCPSIEDKVFRFKDKESHHIFLEPEGFDSDIVYPNGISTSLPADLQERFVRSIPGLESVVFLQYGYAVEYDHVDPTELDRTLRVKQLEGLFLAGQINGTSGYEEAAAQGLIAGINAALFAKDRGAFTLGRDEAYIGVMVDDLITTGVLEPYRMFTSRAEYRLYLREDNADARLTPMARRLGLVADEHWRKFEQRQEKISGARTALEQTMLRPTAEINQWLEHHKSASIADSVSLADILRRPELGLADLQPWLSGGTELSDSESFRVETEVKFAGYLKRQQLEIERLSRMEEVPIPENFIFADLSTLSIEVRERLSQVKPQTLGQASRIPGVTPAALSIISIHIKKVRSRQRDAGSE